MPIVYSASDTVEPIADTDAEAFGNAHLYGVISGCAVTYNAATMTYDVAAGTILHNGSVVNVSAQANAGTLVADGTNPRWATIYLDSTGVEGLVSGTAAADPSKPETGDNVAIAMVLIEAGQTIANNISVKLDKRVWTHQLNGEMKYVTDDQTFTDDTFKTITASSGNFDFYMAANEKCRVRFFFKFSDFGAAASDGFKFQLTGPAAPAYVRIEAKYDQSDGTPLEVPRVGVASAFSSALISTNEFNSGAAAGLNPSYPIVIEAVIVNGSTAGTVTAQGANNTNGAGTATLDYGDMVLERLGTAA